MSAEENEAIIIASKLKEAQTEIMQASIEKEVENYGSDDDNYGEDILGTQSLLVSASEEELEEDVENNQIKESRRKSPKKKISPKRAEPASKEDIDKKSNNDVSEQHESTNTYQINEENKIQENFNIKQRTALIDTEGEDVVQLSSKNAEKEHKKKSSAFIDSDNEDEMQKSSKETMVSPEKGNKNFNIKKPRLLIDSESEDDMQRSFKPDEKELDILKNTTLNQSKQYKKKISTLIDSESEEESESHERHKSNKISRLVDTDDEIEEKTDYAELKMKYARKAITDSESDEEHAKKSRDEHKEDARKEKKKFSTLVDSDTDSDTAAEKILSDAEEDNSRNNVNSNDEAEKNDKNKNNNKTKQMRASAKKCLDDMQAIQSEQQRLHREAYISVPYHKPKKYTLQEFLKRRTIIKPQFKSEGSPAAAIVQSKSLKMTSEELEEYAKLMEDRAKEATEFFKSESEDEIEEFKDNEGVLDKDITIESIIEQIVPVTENNTEVMEMDNTLNGDEKNCNSLKISENKEQTEKLLQEEMSNNATAVEDQTKTPSKLKILITEVIELPKLDLNTLHITTDNCNPNIAGMDTTSAMTVFSITSDDIATSTTKPQLKTAENLKRLIAEKNLTDSPTLQGNKNMLIDLDSGDLIAKKPTGVENLLQRLIATNKHKKAKTTGTLNILSTENGKLEMSKVQIHHAEENDPNMEHKPGAAYLKLKENLKSIIKKKRLEDMQRKQEEENEYNKCLDDYDDTSEEEYEPDAKPRHKLKNNKEDIIIDDEENELNVNDEEDILEVEDEEKLSSCQRNDLDNKQKDIQYADDDDEIKANIDEDIVNNVNDNDDDEENDEEDSVDDDDDVEDESNKCTKRKNRIIKAFQDESDEEVDFLKTQNFLTNTNTATKLYETEPQRSVFEEQDELMALCSGNFETTQNAKTSALMSQIPITQLPTEHTDADELLELCSGTFDDDDIDDDKLNEKPNGTQELITIKMPETNQQIILSSDEETKRRDENTQKRIKKLTKRMKKKTAKLGFSDDEEDEEEENLEELDNEDEDEVAANNADMPETFIDYDSEENEIVVEMSKKDRVLKASNFFEKEAELSESEWGSADEDEKNLDKYDIELGDEDEFDRAKLQAELGQIHARKMIDKDIREVRQIQEMLFEDEETDGVGRQRQFKWKNAESGFSLDDSKRDANPDAENGDSADEENEHLWRKIRFEREQLLKEQREREQKEETSSMIETANSPLHSSTTTMTTAGSVKKINIITAKKTSCTAVQKKSPFLISNTATATTLHKKTVRGSFLVRDKEILHKLAGLTKGNANDMGTPTGTVSVKDVKAKNFVFATLTEEEHETLKRKADDLMNSSSENGINYMKKPKIEPRRAKCLIDQLL